MKNRIYGENVSIDIGKVKGFYNQQVIASETQMGSVLLGSQDPEILEQKNAYCRDHILPMLGANDRSRVLDLGCGVGRWAEFILPQCGLYYGVDFSEGMIRKAEQTCWRLGGFYSLHCMSIPEAATKTAEFYGGENF